MITIPKYVNIMFSEIKNSRYMQYIAAIAATSTFICIGLSFTWPSPSLPRLQSTESPVGRPITDEEGSWLVSVMFLIGIPGCLLASYTIDKFGRRRNILITSTITCIHFFVVGFANSYQVLLAARIIGAFSMSVAAVASTIYTSEIAEVDIRGKLSTYLMLLKASGSLLGLVIGPYLSYKLLGVFSASIPILTIAVFYCMPETPFFLVKTHKVEEARKCLEKLSGRNVYPKDIQERLIIIEETVQNDMQNKTSVKEFFRNRKYRYAIFLMIGIKTLQQMSGSMALESYLQKIIELTKSGIKPEIVSIIIGSIQLPAVFTASILVDKIGRRPLLMISSFGCFIALCAVATYFLIQDSLSKSTSSITWLPPVGLGLFWIMNSIGILTLPYVLMGELFPTNIKGIAVSFLSIYGACAGFVASKFFKPMSNALGMHSVLYFFGGICFFGTCFVYFFLPETKGKNFLEIQKLVCRENEDENVRTVNDRAVNGDYGTIVKIIK